MNTALQLIHNIRGTQGGCTFCWGFVIHLHDESHVAASSHTHLQGIHSSPGPRVWQQIYFVLQVKF